MNNMMIQIRSEQNNPMSRLLPATPKNINALKELCPKYENMFKLKYFVHRYLVTPRGLRKI
jgi:hypothetical protein